MSDTDSDMGPVTKSCRHGSWVLRPSLARTTVSHDTPLPSWRDERNCSSSSFFSPASPSPFLSAYPIPSLSSASASASSAFSSSRIPSSAVCSSCGYPSSCSCSFVSSSSSPSSQSSSHLFSSSTSSSLCCCSYSDCSCSSSPLIPPSQMPSETNIFEVLPPRLLSIILSFLSFEQIAMHTQRVCKAWCESCHSPFAFMDQRVSLSSPSAVITWAPCFTLAKELILQDDSATEDALFALIPHISRVKRLNVTPVSQKLMPRTDHARVFTAFANAFRALTHLVVVIDDIEGFSADEECAVVMSFAKHFPHLKSLQFTPQYSIVDSACQPPNRHPRLPPPLPLMPPLPPPAIVEPTSGPHLAHLRTPTSPPRRGNQHNSSPTNTSSPQLDPLPRSLTHSVAPPHHLFSPLSTASSASSSPASPLSPPPSTPSSASASLTHTPPFSVIEHCFSPLQLCLHVLSSCPNLTHLRWESCFALSDDVLWSVAQHCPKLKHLFLLPKRHGTRTRISNAAISAFASGCPNLCTLTLQGWSGVSAAQIDMLLTLRPSISHLILYGCPLAPEQLNPVLASHQQVTRISFYYGRFFGSPHVTRVTIGGVACGAHELVEVLNGCPNARHVKLGVWNERSFGQLSCEDVANIRLWFPNVEEVVFQRDWLKDACLSEARYSYDGVDPQTYRVVF